jgi:hypothetical protein
MWPALSERLKTPGVNDVKLSRQPSTVWSFKIQDFESVNGKKYASQ